MFMSCENLAKALRRMSRHTDGVMCPGCGYEHDCSINGCAIIGAAADKIEKLERANAVIDEIADAFDRGHCHHDGVEQTLADWYGRQNKGR